VRGGGPETASGSFYHGRESEGTSGQRSSASLSCVRASALHPIRREVATAAAHENRNPIASGRRAQPLVGNRPVVVPRVPPKPYPSPPGGHGSPAAPARRHPLAVVRGAC